MTEWSVRKPTAAELAELAEVLMSDYEERQVLKQLFRPLTKQQVIDYLDDSYVMVLDSYVSDAQGYAGQIYEIIWGNPEYFTRLIRNSKTGKLEILQKR